MASTHSISLPKLTVDPNRFSYFRFGELADGVILTTEAGAWHHLSKDTFRALLSGDLSEDADDFQLLSRKGILRAGHDPSHTADAMRRQKKHVGLGPTLHRIHLSDASGTLSVELATAILDLAMLSTASHLELRLIEGPQPADEDLIRFILQYATEKNRYEGKALQWSLATTLAHLPAGLDELLVAKNVRVLTWLDGPEALHDAQRSTSGAAPHAEVVARLAALRAAGDAKGRDASFLQAEVTLTSASVEHAASILPALTHAGITHLRLAPVTAGAHAVSASDFEVIADAVLDAVFAEDAPFREPLIDHLIARAVRGEAEEPLEARSPGGRGTGQLTYAADGRIFPSEAARVHPSADEMFLLGTAGDAAYRDVVTHPTVRTLAIASTLECLPGATDHWATPYVGIDPTQSFAERGDLFTVVPTCAPLAMQRSLAAAVFERIIRANPATLADLRGR